MYKLNLGVHRWYKLSFGGTQECVSLTPQVSTNQKRPDNIHQMLIIINKLYVIIFVIVQYYSLLCYKLIPLKVRKIQKNMKNL
jgi:hypothetical protein